MNLVNSINPLIMIEFLILVCVLAFVIRSLNKDFEYNKKKEKLLEIGFKQSFYYTLPDDGEIFVKYNGNDKSVISERVLKQMSKEEWETFLQKNQY